VGRLLFLTAGRRDGTLPRMPIKVRRSLHYPVRQTGDTREEILLNASMERQIERIIVDKVYDLGRPDLFREPLISFSSASDERYWDLKTIIGEWHKTPSEFLPDAQSVISYFVPFTRSVAEQPQTVEHGSFLWSQAYVEINQHFNVINEAVSNYLQNLGHSVATIPATHTYDPKDLRATWSHRSAAAIAGLGAFGVNRLLITEKGSAGRFCTVITSAKLTTDSPPMETLCLYIKNRSCDLCLKICPVQALKPDSFAKFDCQAEVNKNARKMEEEEGPQGADTCGKCISVCPFAYIE
jgi:epoxyqueuosine reductase